MALEPSLQLSLFITPAMVMLGWMKAQPISLPFDTGEFNYGARVISDSGFISKNDHSGSDCGLSLCAHVHSVCTWRKV